MSTDLVSKIGLLALTLHLLGCDTSDVSFSADVQPIFDKHCIECHEGSGEGVTASGFSVRDYDSVMKGTNLGKVVVSGSSMSSTLYLVAAGKTSPEIQMPPHHPESLAKGRRMPLSDEEVGIIQAWIDQGAKNN